MIDKHPGEVAEAEEPEPKGKNKNAAPRIEPERAKAFKQTKSQLDTFHREISILSRKKPDDPLNTFKLGLINETLEKANLVLGDEFRPFPSFKSFDVTNIPSASDVVLMISHYIDGLNALRKQYSDGYHWRLIGGGTLEA